MRVLLLAIAATCWWALIMSQTTSTPPPPKLDDAAKKCLAQEHLAMQDLIDFINGKIKAENVSANLKCYIRCHMEARGYMKDGQLLEAAVVKDVANNITSIEMMRKILSNCKIVQGKDLCETSFNAFMCISKELM